MTPTQLTLRLEMDEEPLAWFPVVQSLNVVVVEGLNLAREGDAVYAPLALDQVVAPRILVVQPDGDVTLRLGGQTTSNVPIEGKGLFLLYDGALNTPDSECKADLLTRVTAWMGGF